MEKIRSGFKPRVHTAKHHIILPPVLAERKDGFRTHSQTKPNEKKSNKYKYSPILHSDVEDLITKQLILKTQ